MKMSKQGLDLLIEREGIRYDAYLDTEGVWTIGVGHTGPEVVQGLHWTAEQVEDAFEKDVIKFEDSVNACVKVDLRQNEFDALVSFAHNCGVNALPHGGGGGQPSSILYELNKRNYGRAGDSFNNWMANAAVRTRRAAEREQFRGTRFVATVSPQDV